jgi:hypothetical protein
MGTTEKRAFGLDTVTDDLASAVIADRRQLVDGALKAIKRMGVARRNDLEGQVIVVAADFTSSHRASYLGSTALPDPNSRHSDQESPA